MKTIIINASPNLNNGNTGLILNPLIEGIKEAGSEVEIFYLYKMNINFCQGCVKCLIEEDGKCSQNDDMGALLESFFSADLKVFATPLYSNSVSAPLKNFFDRLYGIFWPQLEVKNNLCVHPVKKYVKQGVSALVSSCGAWELENYKFLLDYMKYVNDISNQKKGGALLRPHAAILKFMIKMNMGVDDIFEAARQGGRELVTKGKFSKQTQATVCRELLPRNDYIKRVNDYYKEIMDQKNNEI